MPDERSREASFRFLIFTANLQPGDANYTTVIVAHISKPRAMGHAGFDVPISPTDRQDRAAEVGSYAAFFSAVAAAPYDSLSLFETRRPPDERSAATYTRAHKALAAMHTTLAAV